MNVTDVTTAILAGQLDDQLDFLANVIRDRKEAKARITYFALKVGDKVRFVRSAHPRYLAGVTGTLREHRNKKVVVDLDQPAGRFHRGIVTPVALIEQVA